MASTSTLVKSLLKIAFAGGLISWMVSQGHLNFSHVGALLSPTTLVVALALVCTSFCINSYRWLLLLRAQSINISYLYAIKLTFIGSFFNFFMPGGVGGDVMKGYYLIREFPQKRASGAISIILDRILGLYNMVLIGLIALLINREFVFQTTELKTLFFSVLLVFVGFSIVMALSFSRRVNRLVGPALEGLPLGKQMRKIYDAFHAFRNHIRTLVAGLLLSSGSLFFSMAMFWWASRFIDGGTQLDVSKLLFIVPLGMIATALPISPAGIGVGQAAFLVLTNWSLGTQSSIGADLVTGFQMITFILGALGAIPYFRMKAPSPKEALDVG